MAKDEERAPRHEKNGAGERPPAKEKTVPRGADDYDRDVEYLIRKRMLLDPVDALSEQLESWVQARTVPRNEVTPDLQVCQRDHHIPLAGERREHGLNLKDTEGFRALTDVMEEESVLADGQRKRVKDEREWWMRTFRPWEAESRSPGPFPVIDRRLVWVVVPTFAIVCCTLLWLGVTTHDSSRRIERHLDAIDAKTEDHVEAKDSTAVVQRLEERKAEAEAAVQAYFAAAGWREKLAFVRHPDVTGPRMRVHYEERGHPCPATPISGVYSHGATYFDGGSVHGFVVGLKATGEKIVVHAVDSGTEPARIGVDWEALTGYADVPLDDFLRAGDPATGPIVFQLFMKPDAYHAGLYDDVRTYACFRLRDRDDTMSWYGYVRRDSEAAFSLESAFMQARIARRGQHVTEIPATVALRFADAASARQSEIPMVEIAAFLGDRWVLPPQPRDVKPEPARDR